MKTINFLRGGTDEKLKIIGVRSFLDLFFSFFERFYYEVYNGSVE